MHYVYETHVLLKISGILNINLFTMISRIQKLSKVALVVPESAQQWKNA